METETNFNAEFFELSNVMCFRIPYKNGKGFLKSAIGYHGLNDKGRLLNELLDDKPYIDWGAGQFCDLDGYLAISILSGYMCYVNKREEIELELKEIIKQVFPHITGFFDGGV